MTDSRTTRPRRFVEVWGDTADQGHLAWSIGIGVVVSLTGFLIANKVLKASIASPELARAYAMLAGLAGCVVAGVICAFLFAPKREVVEGTGADAFWREEVLAKLAAQYGGLGLVTDLPPAVVKEMKELQLYDLFADYQPVPAAKTGERMMDAAFLDQLLWATGMGLVGAVVFAAIGLVSGTDETTTLAPLTLLVVLLGVPAVGVFTFFLAAAVAKHMTHAVPTALLGIPGDTMATPLLQDANVLRHLGVPHIALRKMVSGGIIAAFVAVPLAVLFAVLLAPFGPTITKAAPWIFVAAAVLIAYFSGGRWASVVALVPFVVVIIALQTLTAKYNVKLSISYFLGIAIGPLVADLFSVISPTDRARMQRDSVRTFQLAPDVKSWSGYFPNPFKVLDRDQTKWTLATATVSSATFVFSPVAMTVVLGELVGSRIKHAYHRLTTVLSARNGVTEATYIAEALIPLIAFGLPLSPVAAGPAAPLFNAPPRFTVDTATGQTHNLHNLLSSWEFLGYGMLAVVIAALVSYPFAMNYARRAALFVSTRVSHEAVIATFIGLIVVISVWEGQYLGLLVITVIGLMGGLLSRTIGFNAGVQFMGYYTAVLTVPALLKLVA